MHTLTLFSCIGSEGGDYLKLAPHTRTSNRGSSWISCFRLWWWTILAYKILEKGDQQGLGGKSMWVKIIIHSIGNSLSNTAFQDYVETKIFKRQQKLIKKQNLTIQVLPKFAEMFDKTLMISSRLCNH